MCRVVNISISIFFAVAVLSKETRRTEQETEERWIWGHIDENGPSDNKNIKLAQLLDSVSAAPVTTSSITTSQKAIITTEVAKKESISIPQALTAEAPSTATTTTEPTTTTTQKIVRPNFCEDLNVPPPEKPDYRSPGRRINEAKCLEYMWQQKNRIREKKTNARCDYLQSKMKINRRRRPPGGQFVVGGRTSKPGEFPHMGAVGWKAVIGTWVFQCGCSLISEKFVLTAAHCSSVSPKDPLYADIVPKIIRLGDKYINDEEYDESSPKRSKDVNITRIIIHPQYKAPVKYYDIALMELEEEVKFTMFIQPACLWNSFDTSSLGSRPTLSGWGVIEFGSFKSSPELRAATVDVLESSQCDVLLKGSRNRNWNGFHDDQLCAGKLVGGVDACQGDSGGPLQMKMNLSQAVPNSEGSMYYVIGIISFGVGCAHRNLPGIYTRVSSFVDWIEENVWTNKTQFPKHFDSLSTSLVHTTLSTSLVERV